MMCSVGALDGNLTAISHGVCQSSRRIGHIGLCRLRQYIADLAGQKEQELSVLDKEAQRCRIEVTRPAAPVKPAPAKNNKTRSGK